MITGVPLKAINQYLDRDLSSLGIALVGAGSRHVRADGLLAVRLVHEFADTFSLEARIELARKALQAPGVKSIGLNEGKIAAAIAPARKTVAAGLKAYNAAKAMVRSDPAIFNGEPCLKGTRQSVYTIADLLAESGRDEVVLAYPDLSNEQIEAARLYALASPRRGRPRSVEDVIARTKAKPRRTRSIQVE